MMMIDIIYNEDDGSFGGTEIDKSLCQSRKQQLEMKVQSSANSTLCQFQFRKTKYVARLIRLMNGCILQKHCQGTADPWADTKTRIIHAAKVAPDDDQIVY